MIFNNYKKIHQKAQIKSREDDAFYLMGSNFAGALFSKSKDPSFFYKLFKSWDEQAEVPYDMGVYLEDLVSNPDYVVGVHRTDCGTDYVTESEIISKICTEGLINTGDLVSSGAYVEMPQPYKTVSFVDNIFNLIITLKGRYKYSNSAVVLAIPSEYIDKEGRIIPGHESDVYNVVNGICYIKPEFIATVVQQDNERLEFFSRDQLQKDLSR